MYISGINSIKMNIGIDFLFFNREIGDVDFESIVGKIEIYLYYQDVFMKFDVIIIEGNIIMNINVSMLIIENGYVDIVGRKVLVNFMIIIFLDNLIENMFQIVIGNKIYIKISFGVNEINFMILWDFYFFRLVEVIIQEELFVKYIENGIIVFVYLLLEDVIFFLVEVYFSLGDLNVMIMDVVFEIYVVNGIIIQIKLVYLLVVKMFSDDVFGYIEVIEIGIWKSMVRIILINEKREVEFLII